jgi:hypothetical protein
MTPADYPRVKCPRCGRMLEASGDLRVGELYTPVYTCPECISVAKIGNETMELPLCFAIDKDGRPFDPALPDDRMYLDGK